MKKPVSRLLLTFVFSLTLPACATIPDGMEEFTPPLVELPGDGFVFFGDFGTGSSDQLKVARAIETFCQRFTCEFGALLGDNFYPKGVESVSDAQWQSAFERPYGNLPFKFLAALGNHDYMGKIKAQIDYKSAHWSMPARYFSARYQDRLEMFFLDTEVIGRDGRQLQWFEEKLKASTAKWKVAIGHHPVFSGGLHGDSSTMKSKVLPLAKKYGLDFFLSGHDHDLQVIEREGLNFVVSGAAAKLRSVKKVTGTLFAESKLGFAHFEVIDERRIILRIIDAQNNILFSSVYER